MKTLESRLIPTYMVCLPCVSVGKWPCYSSHSRFTSACHFPIYVLSFFLFLSLSAPSLLLRDVPISKNDESHFTNGHIILKTQNITPDLSRGAFLFSLDTIEWATTNSVVSNCQLPIPESWNRPTVIPSSSSLLTRYDRLLRSDGGGGIPSLMDCLSEGEREIVTRWELVASLPERGSSHATTNRGGLPLLC